MNRPQHRKEYPNKDLNFCENEVILCTIVCHSEYVSACISLYMHMNTRIDMNTFCLNEYYKKF